MEFTVLHRLDRTGYLRTGSGNKYAFDFFFAERHTGESNFLLSTSIDFRPDPSYVYPVSAFDPDGDDLSYRLTSGPEGMKLNETSGVLTWSPDVEDIGEHSVTIEVLDGKGALNITDLPHSCASRRKQSITFDC